MRNLRIASIPVLLLLSIHGLQAGVEVEIDKKADFSGFRTYAWLKGTPAARPEAEQRIRTAVEHELQSKGLRTAADSPDLLVVTHVLADRHTLEELSDPDTLGYWAAVRSADAFELGAGTLVLDLVDAGSRRLVWRGVAARTVKGSVEKMGRKIDNAVRDLFRNYPAK